MSQLKIVDLDFCERQFPNKNELKGGGSISSSSSSYSTSGRTPYHRKHSHTVRSQNTPFGSAVASASAFGNFTFTTASTTFSPE